jgi:hypothetical protein
VVLRYSVRQREFIGLFVFGLHFANTSSFDLSFPSNKAECGKSVLPLIALSHRSKEERKMKHIRFPALCFLLVPAVLGVAQTPAAFGGYYQTSNVSAVDGQVQLTFSAQVSNNTGGDIANATISLIDTVVAKPPYAQFSGISITNGNTSAALTQSVTIPKYLYDSWQNGGAPQVSIDFSDASGNAVHNTFSLVAQPAQ